MAYWRYLRAHHQNPCPNPGTYCNSTRTLVPGYTCTYSIHVLQYPYGNNMPYIWQLIEYTLQYLYVLHVAIYVYTRDYCNTYSSTGRYTRVLQYVQHVPWLWAVGTCRTMSLSMDIAKFQYAIWPYNTRVPECTPVPVLQY